MRSSNTTLRFTGLLVLVTVIVLSPIAIYADRTTSVDPIMVVIPVRSAPEIAADIGTAQAAKNLAIDRNRQAVDRLQQIANAIDDREASIEDLDRRKDRAEDDKHGPEKKSLEIEAKANKKAIDLLKRLIKLREAEVEVAEVEAEHADINIRVYQMESELQSRRQKQDWHAYDNTGDLTKNTEVKVIHELEVSLLKLQEESASVAKELASKQKEVVKERMRLHKAQLKLGI